MKMVSGIAKNLFNLLVAACILLDSHNLYRRDDYRKFNTSKDILKNVGAGGNISKLLKNLVKSQMLLRTTGDRKL